ncbi:hypothetical protein BB560_004079, partial [Smittium megazygosporum]
TVRWMKRYCQTVGRGNTVKALQHRYTVNDKTKISAWIKAHNMRNTGSWMDLQIQHPDIKLGHQDIGKIRMGCYWTAQRLAKAGLIPKMYIERCPFCNKNTPETIEHMLIECFRWNSIRHETTIFNIPRLYRTVTIDQSTNNKALNQGTATWPYMKELETGQFMNGIRVVRTLILDRIKCSPAPLNQCPVGMESLEGQIPLEIRSYEFFENPKSKLNSELRCDGTSAFIENMRIDIKQINRNKGSSRLEFYVYDDLLYIIKRAQGVGLDKIIITGGSLDESIKALELSKSDAGGFLYSTVGCHPTRSNEMNSSSYKSPEKYFDRLLNLIKDGGNKVVAVGECGLDYDRTHFADIETQKMNTNGDFVDIIKKNRSRFTNGVVHSFTSGIEEMQELVNLGLYIGINGCSLKTEENLEVAKAIPEDRIMIETDCPYCEIRKTHASYKYLSPSSDPSVTKGNPGGQSTDILDKVLRADIKQKNKNQWSQDHMVKGRNEPFTIPQVLRVLARIRNRDEDELAQKIYENTCKVFFPHVKS